jgi:hypothetical protein
MHKPLQNEVTPPDEQAAEVAVQEPVVENSWSRISRQVSHALPRLREIAVYVALTGPIVMYGSDGWGFGGGHGC